MLPKKADVTIALTPYANHSMGPLNFSFKFSNENVELTEKLTSLLENLNNQGKIVLQNCHQFYETWFGVICTNANILEPIFNEVGNHNIYKVKFLETGLDGNLDIIPSNLKEIRKVAKKIVDRPNNISLYEI